LYIVYLIKHNTLKDEKFYFKMVSNYFSLPLFIILSRIWDIRYDSGSSILSTLARYNLIVCNSD
jgi:hypothetical protein